MMNIRKWGFASILSLLVLASPARAAPEVGWWWNPAESGRGFFVESQNGVMYLAGYFYEPDGRATWLVSGGANADPYAYQGRLLAFADGQTLFGDYKPPPEPLDAGPVAISFSDDSHGTIVWPGGTVPIVRHIFGVGPAAFAPESGWWWNEAESGRGYTIEVQGDKLFVVAFMYDDAGHPVWYFSAGTMATPTTYAGPWLQFANGQTLTGPYRPPGEPVVVGELNLEFTAPDEATLTFRDAATATGPRADLKKGSKIIYIKRQFKMNKPSAARPERWTGAFVIEDETVNERKPSSGRPGQTQITKWKWTAQEIDLERDDTIDTGKESTYYPKRGVVVSEVSYFQVTSDNKELCESKPNQNFIASLTGDAVTLVVNDRGESWGYIKLPFAAPGVLLTCQQNGKTVSSVLPLPISLYYSLPRKTIEGGVIEGRVADQVILDYDDSVQSSKRTVSSRWAFLPAK